MGKNMPEAVEIADTVVFQELHDEAVILDMESQQYYALDSVGADAWRLLLEHKSIADAAKGLRDMYEIDEQTARRDLDTLVEELLAAGLVKECSTAS